MYWLVKNYLKKNGYNQYEISNFSKAGYYSRHNTDCWKQKEYIGFGVAAHSYFNMKRYSNICDVEKYIRNLENKEIEKNVEIHEVQNIESKMNEYMILGLRMIEGVNVKKFKEIFHQDVLEKYKKQLEKLQKEKLIYFDNEKIYLTNKGIDFANIVWEEFDKMRALNKECFIRQKYDYGDRLEYDFGEVHLFINDQVQKLYVAVLSSPASNFR